MQPLESYSISYSKGMSEFVQHDARETNEENRHRFERSGKPAAIAPAGFRDKREQQEKAEMDRELDSADAEQVY